MNNVDIEYVPENFVHEVSITIKCKKSEFEKYQNWFETFKRQREIDLKVINTFINPTKAR